MDQHAQRKVRRPLCLRRNRLPAGPSHPARQPHDGNSHLGLALFVIATAQLMVVLDSAIVNVALPHIQRALGFSGSGLEWVVTAYAVTFGGLLLLGGRSGDLLGRRKIFISGLLLFSAASLLGGFATSEAWLLVSRALQGVGGAMVAPTALALITTTFPEGSARNRAMGVYAAMSGGGAAVGLIARRPAHHVPLVALGAVRERADRHRHRDLRQVRASRVRRAGAVASTCPAPSPSPRESRCWSTACPTPAPIRTAVSHWADGKVIVSLVASVVLLVAFGLIESRSRHALMPLRILANRSRTGAYVVMLCLATAMFGIFFFLTIFVQEVLGLQRAEVRRRVPARSLCVVVLMSGSRVPGHRAHRPAAADADRRDDRGRSACSGSRS